MGLAAAIGVAQVALSATAILQSVAIVGAVVSVVGTVTKNPVLSKIGMGLGLVGGIGALATSALGLSSTALFGTAGEVTSSVATDAVSAAAGGAEGAIGAAEGGWTAAAPDVVGDLSGGAMTAAADPAAGAAWAADPATTLGAAPTGEVPTGLIGSNTTTAAAADPAAGLGGSVTPPTGADASAVLQDGLPRAPLDLGSQSAATGQTITQGIDPATGLASSLPAEQGSSGLMSTLLGYVEKHPTMAFGALQGASSLLSGWTSSLTPAQVAALNSQAAQNQAAANLASQQAANLAMPKAVASSAPVTGTPQPIVQGGLINQAPAQVTVTGKAA